MKVYTKLKKSFVELSLEDSELRYRRLFETAQDGILILDAQSGAISDVNPFLINMLGYTRDEFIGRKLWQMGAFSDIEASKEAFEALQANEYIRYEDLPLKTKTGMLIDVEFVSNVYMVGAQKVIQCNIRNITERKLAQEALLQSKADLREQSIRDFLTGLYNRRYLEVTLEREILRAARQHFQLGIIMLDVDNFKYFNDTYGHLTGDAILQELGNMLMERFRGDDVASRYGGDEFLIVLPNASRKITCDRAEMIRQNVSNFQANWQYPEAVTLSIGVAIYPEHGTTSSEVLKAADGALYRAKNEGRNQVVVVD